MAKPHSKLIYILTTLLIVSTILLLSSCGSNNPTGAKAPNAMTGPNGAVGGCTPSIPLGRLDPKMYWPASGSIPAASIPDLLRDQHANPNASGALKPFSQLCGDYLHEHGDLSTGQGYTELGHSYSYVYRIDVYSKSDGWGGWIPISGDPNVRPVWVEQSMLKPHKLDFYHIDCNLFPPGTMLPNDFFAGSGYPDGDYVYGGDWFNKSGGTVTPKGRVTPCTPDGPYPPPKLTSLLITPVDVSIGVNKTIQLNVRGMKSDGSIDAAINNSNVTWTSSDASIAVVYNGGTSGGYVLGKSKGNATISATYGSTPSNVVVVHVGNQLQSISVSPASTTIYLHPTAGTKQYIASGSYSDGSTQAPISATWDTLPGGIATIDANGLATAVSPGTTYISAASTADGTTITSGAYDAELEVLWYRYVHFLQIDPAWTTDPYAWHTLAETQVPPYTEYNTALGTVSILKWSIGAKGCAMTSVAMGLATLGINTNPHALNANMQQDDYYDSENGVIWDVLKAYSNGNIIGVRYPGSSQIKSELDKGNIVIVNVKYKSTSTKYGHWVILEKYKGNTYYSYDPTWGERTFTSLSDFKKVVVGITK